MQDPQRAIEKHIGQSISHQRCGEYSLGYSRITEALRLATETDVDDDTRCRVLVEASRCAYYLTRFEESENYLKELRAHLGSPRDGNARLRWAAALIAANIHRRRGDFEKALGELAAHLPDRGEYPPPILIEKLLVEGSCWFYRNEMKNAEEKLEAALGLAIHHGDQRLRSRVLTMLGFLARSKGQLRRAQDCLLRASALCRADSDFYGEAAACLNLGIIKYQTGAFIEAERLILRAKAIFEKIEWRLGACRCLLALGNVKRHRRQFTRARALYEKAKARAQRDAFARETALAEEYLGDVHRERCALDEAERHYRAALDIAHRTAPEGDVAVEVYRRLGELHLNRGEFRRSLELLGKGHALARKLAERVEEALILRATGTALMSMGKRPRGMRIFRRGLRLLSAVDSRFELGISHLLFAEALLGVDASRAAVPREGELRDSGEMQEAWQSLVEAGHLLQDIDAPFWRSRVDALMDAVTVHRRHAPRTAGRFEAKPQYVEVAFDPRFVISGTIAGISSGMMDAWQRIQFAARAPWPVLITGETGTGKELAARAIHGLSERRDRPFVAVNCAALPDHLFESELFGHRRGCFTGAVLDRRGLLEEANGGTLFLDEIGELTPLQQAKLLRVLQESAIRRVGENIERKVDVRFISATNQDLDRKIAGDGFRKDFYYRINAEHIHMPPLRERPEDILPLMAFFLCRCADKETLTLPIESSVLRIMQLYPWPGNVRELFSVLERIKHISKGGSVSIDMLPERISSHRLDAGGPGSMREISGGAESAKLREVLSLCNWNKSAAARRLGVSRGTLYKEMRRNGLKHLIRNRSTA